MKTGPIPKLSPRYCEPFTIIKRKGEVAYKLDLPNHSKIHPVFHVSRLRKRLGPDANIMDEGVLEYSIEPPI